MMYLLKQDTPGPLGRIFDIYTLHEDDGQEVLFDGQSWNDPRLLRATRALKGAAPRFLKVDHAPGRHRVSLRTIHAGTARPARLELGDGGECPTRRTYH